MTTVSLQLLQKIGERDAFVNEVMAITDWTPSMDRRLDRRLNKLSKRSSIDVYYFRMEWKLRYCEG